MHEFIVNNWLPVSVLVFISSLASLTIGAIVHRKFDVKILAEIRRRIKEKENHSENI